MSKTMLVLLLLLLLGAQAFGADSRGCPVQALRCVSPELANLSQSGHSLVVDFPAGETSATAILEDLSFSREQQTRVYKRLAELPCRVAGHSGPDTTQTVLTCEDQHLVDAGYLIELQGADLAGRQRVRVTERRFLGPVELANLPCAP